MIKLPVSFQSILHRFAGKVNKNNMSNLNRFPTLHHCAKHPCKHHLCRSPPFPPHMSSTVAIRAGVEPEEGSDGGEGENCFMIRSLTQLLKSRKPLILDPFLCSTKQTVNCTATNLEATLIQVSSTVIMSGHRRNWSIRG